MAKRLKEIMEEGRIRPDVLQTVLLDELCGRMEELGEKFDKVAAFSTFMGPMTRLFLRGKQYQFATIPAGGSGRIYYITNPIPAELVGVITQVGNDWYPHTYLEWLIDGLPKRVEYVIADPHIPKEYQRGIPFDRDVEWIAYNNDGVAHTFEVLCDGFFIPRELYDKIVGEQP